MLTVPGVPYRQRPMNRTTPADEGAAIVEFAIVAVLLLTILAGIIEFGRAYSMNVRLTGAVRDGARAAALGASSGTVQSVTTASSNNMTLTFPTLTTCAPGATGNAVVSAQTVITVQIPLIGRDSITLRQTGTMRCGG